MERFTYEDALAASIEYFDGDKMAAGVFTGKYALKDDTGAFVERTPDDMHKRMAREFARIEAKYPNPMSEKEIYSLLCKRPGRLGMGPVIPQGSPMSAIGNPFKMQSLSNCFVIESPEDSYAGIFFSDQEEAQIMKRRGGVGFDISTIRPRGLPTANAAGTTDGIGVFMERFSNTCREVAQGGRRGALMLTVSVKHPEIETFIHIKRDKKKVTGANISIRMTDDFMSAVDKDEEVTLQWPVDVSLAEAQVTRKVRARDIWEQIVDSAWDSAEPGVLFWDNARKWTPSDAYEAYGHKSVSTNPCGEIVLPPYDSCRLLVIDLTHFVIDAFKESSQFDWAGFHETVIKAQRLMDDLVDLELEAVDKIIAKIEADPESVRVKRIELELWKKIREVGASGRRTGLGVTALGDTLAMLGQAYGSEDSIGMTESIYRALAYGAYKSSVRMAKERGPFPLFKHEIEENHPFIRRVMDDSLELNDEYKKYGRRNIALTTTAPVGSVSTMTQTTSGIEPVFSLSYTRRKKINPNDKDAKVDFIDDMGDKWTHFTIYHHSFKQWMDVTGGTDVKDSPYHLATANEIDWLASVKLQAAAQKWICHSISKTCNLPKSASHDTVSECYLEAWRTGCKGFTVYRDGSRDGVLVTDAEVKFNIAQRLTGIPAEELVKNFEIAEKYREHIPAGYLAYIEEAKAWLLSKNAPVDERKVSGESHAAKRPKELPCDIHRVNVKGETYTVLLGLMDGVPYEVFCGLSQHVEVPKRIKRGTLVKNGKKDGVSTYNLRIPLGDDDILFKDVVNLFDNPTYGAFTRTLSLVLRHAIPLQYVVEQLQKDKHSDMQSFSRVIARVIKGYIPDGTKATSEKKCDNCGAEGTLVYEEGCMKCSECGNSKCG